MGSQNDVPCRVSADLARYMNEMDKREPQELDPWDMTLMIEICGGRFAEPMAELLIKLEQIEKTSKSFGVDKDSALDFILPTLLKLRDACMAEMEQL